MLRTHSCGQLNKEHINQIVKLAGWVNSRRDHGGLIFIDLRDRYGLTQIAFDPKRSQAAWQTANKVRPEYVVQIKGIVKPRPVGSINPKLASGEIEIDGQEITILSYARTPPFEINKSAKEVNENLRLRYRFLDLRRPELQAMLKTRDVLIQHIRAYFHQRDFVEVQTPILANSSPEGARDWLVPSRLYPGKFYALPQAPQQFKQLLMVAGVDRYFQIAPCFRDEDPRQDRHFGEFYQLDMEMSFVEQEDIFQIMEPLMIELTEKFSHKEILQNPFPRISWRDSMNRFGTDKPDLRFELEIKPITDIVKNCGFAVFSQAIKDKGVVHTLKINQANFTRRDIDELTEIAKEKGAGGLAYIKVKSEKLKVKSLSQKIVKLSNGHTVVLESPIVKFLAEKKIIEILQEVKADAGDIIFFSAGRWLVVCESLGAVRDEYGRRLGLKDKNKAAWVWITDFPMYMESEEEKGKIEFAHNPFSMPQGGLSVLKSKKPLDILAYQYDLVCNGYELTSGAIRNSSPEIMYKAFEIAGYSRDDVNKKFGHMIRAFQYGAPPHGGNAPGIDRLLMILLDCDSIRDIYAFPKDGAGRDVMLDAPNKVEEKELKELHLKISDNLNQ